MPNNTLTCNATMLRDNVAGITWLLSSTEKEVCFQHHYIKLIQLNYLPYILSFTRQPWLEWHQSYYQEPGIWILPSRARTSSP